MLLLIPFNNMQTASAKTGKRYIKATSINIRKKPTTKSKSIGIKYWNDSIHVISKVNKKWYEVKYKNKTAYICSKYVSKKRIKYKRYKSPSNNTFKSCLPANCLTHNTSLPQGRLRKKYTLDYKTGVYKVGDRYCVALGSYYTTKIGTKIDLVLSHNGRKHVLKCILADQKADKDTVNNHKVHKDGSVAEFVVHSKVMSYKARYVHGDVSYAGKQFRGKIVQIKVYQK